MQDLVVMVKPAQAALSSGSHPQSIDCETHLPHGQGYAKRDHSWGPTPRRPQTFLLRHRRSAASSTISHPTNEQEQRAPQPMNTRARPARREIHNAHARNPHRSKNKSTSWPGSPPARFPSLLASSPCLSLTPPHRRKKKDNSSGAEEHQTPQQRGGRASNATAAADGGVASVASPVAPPPRAPSSLLLSAFAPVLRVRAVIIVIVVAAPHIGRASVRAPRFLGCPCIYR
nr:unnamed protein product [Digitaria exilis]